MVENTAECSASDNVILVICAQPFDERYKRQCGTGKWSVRYFYNETSYQCERFWYDQCQLDNMNIFGDAFTCQVHHGLLLICTDSISFA